MVKITNVVELKEYKREDGSIFGYDVEYTLNIGGKYIHYFSGKSLEEIRIYLYNINWHKEVLDSLERFRQDQEEEFADESHKNSYEELMKKIENDIALTEKDYKWINECVRICTFFKEFNYKTWVMS